MKKRWFIALLALVLFAVIACWQGLIVRKYTLEMHKLTESIRVVQISDLHACRYGRNQRNLIRKIEALEPDVIVLTGDIADEDKSLDAVEAFLTQITAKFPCYYVSGNHEGRFDDPNEVLAWFASQGVCVLQGAGENLPIKDQTIGIYGLDDVQLIGTAQWRDDLQQMNDGLDLQQVNLLLSIILN